MRIALTHNLRRSDSEDEAEFDTGETIHALTGAMERRGHRVEPIDVSGSLPRLVTHLERFAPQLVFNTAEGRQGRFREAFYPALFEVLDLPWTGSDAHTLALTLNKHLTKLVAKEHGIPTPAWRFIERQNDLDSTDLRFPVIVKPNFEGSSKGITQNSVAETPSALREKVVQALAAYPDGLLVEEFIEGADLTVPFLELAEGELGGVLAPCQYIIDPAYDNERRYAIYDYELKTRYSDAVHPRAPAAIPKETRARACALSHTLIRVLGCRDVGRLDFRLSQRLDLYFLELNALPSLEPGASLFVAARLAGLEFDDVIESIIQSAWRRRPLSRTDGSACNLIRAFSDRNEPLP